VAHLSKKGEDNCDAGLMDVQVPLNEAVKWQDLQLVLSDQPRLRSPQQGTHVDTRFTKKRTNMCFNDKTTRTLLTRTRAAAREERSTTHHEVHVQQLDLESLS
jgi:hypothetical protein